MNFGYDPCFSIVIGIGELFDCIVDLNADRTRNVRKKSYEKIFYIRFNSFDSIHSIQRNSQSVLVTIDFIEWSD